MNPRSVQQDALSNHPANASYVSPDLNGSSIDLDQPSSASELLLALWRERRFLAKAFAIGLVVAAAVSLLLPKEYESTTSIMPPEKQGLGGIASMLAAAGDEKGSLMGGLMSSALGVKSSGALFIGVMKSTAAQDALVNRFDLRHVYHVNYQQDAREVLASNTDIKEDRKSGIITITVTDRSPQRAMEMARSYTEMLGNLTTRLDTSAAHRERVFLEDHLKQVKQDLDSAANDLSAFSSKTLTLDVKEQGKAMVQGTAQLEGELIAAETQMKGLEAIYTSNNVRVRTLQARVNELRRKLSELKGTNPEADNSDAENDFGVSIAKLPALGVTYYDLLRRAKIEETVFEILTKQYELAKIEEAKAVPAVKVLDEAQVPEYKSSPKRTLLTILGAMIAVMLASTYVLCLAYRRNMALSPSHSLFGLEVREGIANDWVFIREHTPASLRRLVARWFPRGDSGLADPPFDRKNES